MTTLVAEPEGQTIRSIGLERLYDAPRDPELVRLPDLQFAMIDGEGYPNDTPAYGEALQALYGVSYTLKFGLKKRAGIVYRVSPLEGLWWADDPAGFTSGNHEGWHWTAMIHQPAEVSPELFDAALDELGRRKPQPALARLRLEPFEEGLCGQVMHIGPYSEEGPTIARLHAFLEQHGLHFDGNVQKHHEIYLGDPRRAAPEKLRTIIRQPVAE